eukprot:gene8384-biopygen5488
MDTSALYSENRRCPPEHPTATPALQGKALGYLRRAHLQLPGRSAQMSGRFSTGQEHGDWTSELGARMVGCKASSVGWYMYPSKSILGVREDSEGAWRNEAPPGGGYNHASCRRAFQLAWRWLLRCGGAGSGRILWEFRGAEGPREGPQGGRGGKRPFAEGGITMPPAGAPFSPHSVGAASENLLAAAGIQRQSSLQRQQAPGARRGEERGARPHTRATISGETVLKTIASLDASAAPPPAHPPSARARPPGGNLPPAWTCCRRLASRKSPTESPVGLPYAAATVAPQWPELLHGTFREHSAGILREVSFHERCASGCRRLAGIPPNGALPGGGSSRRRLLPTLSRGAAFAQPSRSLRAPSLTRGRRPRGAARRRAPRRKETGALRRRPRTCAGRPGGARQRSTACPGDARQRSSACPGMSYSDPLLVQEVRDSDPLLVQEMRGSDPLLQRSTVLYSFHIIRFSVSYGLLETQALKDSSQT